MLGPMGQLWPIARPPHIGHLGTNGDASILQKGPYVRSIFSLRSLIHLIQNSSLSSDDSDDGARAGEVRRLRRTATATAEEKVDAMGAATEEAEEQADVVGLRRGTGRGGGEGGRHGLAALMGVHGGWYAGRAAASPLWPPPCYPSQPPLLLS